MRVYRQRLSDTRLGSPTLSLQNTWETDTPIDERYCLAPKNKDCKMERSPTSSKRGRRFLPRNLPHSFFLELPKPRFVFRFCSESQFDDHLRTVQRILSALVAVESCFTVAWICSIKRNRTTAFGLFTLDLLQCEGIEADLADAVRDDRSRRKLLVG